MKDLIQSSILVTSVRVAGIVLQSLNVLLLAHTLPVVDMGVFAVGFACLGLVRILGPLGTDQVTMRQIASAHGDHLGSDLHQNLNASYVAVFGFNIVATLIAVISIIWISWAASGTQPVYCTGLVIMALAIPAFAIIGLLTAQLRGFNFNVIAQIPDSVILHFMWGTAMLYLWSQNNLSFTTTTVALTTAAWAVATIYTLIRLALCDFAPVKPTKTLLWSLLGESREVLFALSLTSLSARIPLFISVPLLDPAATAIIDIATRFGTLPTITTGAITSTFAPRFAELTKLKDRRAMSSALSWASVLASLPAIAVLLAITIAAPFAVDRALPAAYADAYWPMVLIATATTVNAIFGSSSTFLFMSGHSYIVRNFSLAQLVVLCISILVFGKQYGVYGISGIILLGAFVRDFGLSIWTANHFQISVPPFGLRRS